MSDPAAAGQAAKRRAARRAMKMGRRLRCIHGCYAQGVCAQGVCDLRLSNNGFGVPQPRRPENRATPFDVARLMVWSRDQVSAANTRLGPEYAV